MRDLLLILNFDDASSRAVTRKLRAERVLCKIVPGSISLEDIKRQEPLGLVLAGGALGVVPEGTDDGIWQSGVPVLALGDAALLMIAAFHGVIGEKRLAGTVARLDYGQHPLLQGLENGERMMHCVRELTLPPEFLPICRTEDTVAGFAHASLPFYGLQFVMEQNDPEASQLLCNFAISICGCTTWWDDDAFIARAVEEIGRVVGEGRAMCVMTGGLDTGVSALLAYKALGHRLKCLFVDTGLLRERESEQFMAFYRDTLGMNIVTVYAGERFLAALSGVSGAADKKKRIQITMEAVLREQRERLGAFDAQIMGTCCNDVLYGDGDGFPPLDDTLPMIEPVRELFKDEIRRIGDQLGLPPDLLSRQPFPGGGLALRILGEATRERIDTLRAADGIFRAEILAAGLDRKLWQYFAVLAPMPEDPQGVVICLRAVNTRDQTQACAARLPYDLMETVTDRIRRERPEVRRVVYDLTPSGHYAGIEWK